MDTIAIAAAGFLSYIGSIMDYFIESRRKILCIWIFLSALQGSNLLRFFPGFDSLTPGYFLPPLRGFKKCPALGKTSALQVAILGCDPGRAVSYTGSIMAPMLLW
jgi:hypothetical protein